MAFERKHSLHKKYSSEYPNLTTTIIKSIGESNPIVNTKSVLKKPYDKKNQNTNTLKSSPGTKSVWKISKHNNIIKNSKIMDNRAFNPKNKTLFKIWFKKAEIYVRTVCIVLTYNTISNGINSPHILMIKDPTKKKKRNGIIEFPGGTVEKYDLNVYDTAIREFWEEALTGRELGDKWRDEYNRLKKSGDLMSQFVVYIKNKLKTSRTCILDDTVKLKTLYYVLRISPVDAQYLIEKHKMISIPLSSVKLSDSPTKSSSIAFEMSNGEIVKIRRRDFCALKTIYKKCMKFY